MQELSVVCRLFLWKIFLEPGLISINEERETKLEKLLAPRMADLKTESFSRYWMIQRGFQL